MSEINVLETPATVRVVIDGVEIRHRISSVRLEQYIDRHHVLKIKVAQEGHGAAGGALDDSGVYTGFLGKSVAITISAIGGTVASSRELEFIGLVTEVSLENSIDGMNTAVITAHSPTISLDGSPRIRFWEDQKDSDVISSVVGDYPIMSSVDSTTARLKYTVQHRETDYNFVKRLAEQNGLFTFWDGRGLKIGKAVGGSSIGLRWRETLGTFAMGLGTAASKFSAKAWDYMSKVPIDGDSDTNSLQTAPSDMARLSISASNAIFTVPGRMEALKAEGQSELDGSLKHCVAGQVGRMVRCHGESIVPEVTVGKCAQVAGLGQFDGLYWILEVCHSFDESGKYHNTFVATPLEVAFPPQVTRRAAVTDLQAGTVTDLEDPDGLGRIKVNIPALGIDSPWIRYVSPNAGADRGWVSVPEIDDEVVIGFENSNPDLPIAIGSVYNGSDSPPVPTIDGNNEKIFLTRGGNEIRFTDEDGCEQIKICTKNGDNQIVLDVSGRSISIESTGDISIKGANIKLEAEQGIELKSTADTKIEAMGFLKAKGTAGVDLEASGMCNIKGAMINLN